MQNKLVDVGLDNCYISEITLFELTYGAYNSRRVKAHLAEMPRLESLLSVLPIRPALDKYGRERVRLKRMGKQIPDFDLLIGCTAIPNNLTLVTGNTRHMVRIDTIVLEDWTDASWNQFIEE